MDYFNLHLIMVLVKKMHFATFITFTNLKIIIVKHYSYFVEVFEIVINLREAAK